VTRDEPAAPGGPDPSASTTATTTTTSEHGETARQIRGSGMLTAGRLLSMLATMVALVIVARYLDKADYGAFVYALSIATAFETLIALGLDRAVPRFLPQYDERGQTARFIGTLVLVLGSILVLGLLAVLVVVGLRDLYGKEIAGSDLTPVLLSILILLAPIQAIDNVLTGVFAVFADARVIFLRRFVLAPGLRLLVVLLLVAGGLGPVFLAVGYVAAGLIGVLLYVGLAWRLLRRHLPAELRGRRIEVPLIEILTYTVPLLTTDVVYLAMTTVDTLVLGHTGGVTAVAELRVVDPVARANTLVQASFATLFVPRAARLLARADRGAQRELYWRSATWMAILAFPIFAASFTLAEPVVVLLFGERYRASAIVLAMLALGRYVDTAFGNNGLALRVFGSTRQVVAVNLVVAAANVALVLALTPRFGPPGAAAATMLTLFAYNALKQAALQRATGFALPNRTELAVYASIVVAAVALLVIASFLPDDRVLGIPLALIVGLPLVAVASVALVRFNRDRLDLGGTFPELLRLPLVPFVLGRPAR
jgi:O-antigen/teichoic acid export membrane protein